MTIDEVPVVYALRRQIIQVGVKHCDTVCKNIVEQSFYLQYQAMYK